MKRNVLALDINSATSPESDEEWTSDYLEQIGATDDDLALEDRPPAAAQAALLSQPLYNHRVVVEAGKQI